MEKYLKQFATHSAYNAVKNNLDRPNVVLCVQEDEVHFNKIDNNLYWRDALTSQGKTLVDSSGKLVLIDDTEMLVKASIGILFTVGDEGISSTEAATWGTAETSAIHNDGSIEYKGNTYQIIDNQYLSPDPDNYSA